MADGREEREEQERRRQWEEKRDLEDKVERKSPDPWQPERQES